MRVTRLLFVLSRCRMYVKWTRENYFPYFGLNACGKRETDFSTFQPSGAGAPRRVHIVHACKYSRDYCCVYRDNLVQTIEIPVADGLRILSRMCDGRILAPPTA